MTSYSEKPIFVTGLPRTGTSLVAGLLHGSGAWVGNTITGDANNSKGYFEHAQIRQQIIKPLLSALKADPLGVTQLPPWPFRGKLDGVRRAMLNQIFAEGYDESVPWLYKDAKLLLIWQAIRKEFPLARWVIVRRDINHFVNSCLRTPFMAQHSKDSAFWVGIAAQYLQRLDGLRDTLDSSCEIWTEDLFSDGPAALLPIIETLDLHYDQAAIESFIDDRLFASSVGRGTGETGMLSYIRNCLSGEPMKVNGSVAIVGSSDGLTGKGLGPNIDQHDHVFRFNLAPLGDRFASDVGARPSTYLLSKSVTTLDFPGQGADKQLFESICKHSTIICYPGHFSRILPHTTPFHLELGIHHINGIFSRTLGPTYRPFPHSNHPRNGIKLIAAIINAGIVPSIYGFDFGDRETNTHYYDDEPQVESVAHGHRPSAEYRLLNQLNNRGLIQVGDG